MKRLEQTLLFLTLLFLPTQLGKHFWPQFSYIYSLKIDYLSPTLYFWDLLVGCLGLVWILGKPKVNKIALNLFLFFMLAQSVSLMEAINLGAGLVRLEQYLIAGLFGIYLASSNFKIIFSKLQLPLMIAFLFEFALALMQFIKGETLGFWVLGERSFSLSTPSIAKFDYYGRQFLRPYGTFPHPNVLAAFMVVASILLNKKIITFLAGLTVLLTVSRAAMTAWLIAALWLIKGKGRILLLFLMLSALPILYTRFEATFSYDSLSFLRRESLNSQALNIFLKNPFLGAGLNNFIQVSATDLSVGPSRFLQPVHNIFLLSLAETGLIGLISLISLMGYPILRLFRLYSILLIWAVIISLGLFDHYFLTLPQGYRMLFLVWGLSLSYLKSQVQ